MRKLVFIIVFILASLSYIFKVDELLVQRFTFFNNLKSSYIDKIVSIYTDVEKYFNQAQKIEKLKKDNFELEEYKILQNITQKQLDTLKEFLSFVKISEVTPQIEIVKVLSYISFNDFTKVWLDKIPSDDKILGLISENFAAGIVINQNNKAVGLLNGNKDCSYAVFIGEDKSPGIIISKDKEDELLVKFIPIYSDIKEGDEVITSGMDNIFFEGLKVGRVLEVTEFPDMKMATVKPYINATKKKYFYTYENIANMNLENNTENKIKESSSKQP